MVGAGTRLSASLFQGEGIPDIGHRETASSSREEQDVDKLQSSQADKDLASQPLVRSHCAHRLVAAGLLAMPERTGLCGASKAV